MVARSAGQTHLPDGQGQASNLIRLVKRLQRSDACKLKKVKVRVTASHLAACIGGHGLVKPTMTTVGEKAEMPLILFK